MNMSEFDKECARLKLAFGERHFNAERLRVLWKQFRNERPDIFADAVDWMIAHKRQAPCSQEFVEAIDAAFRKQHQREQKAIQTIVSEQRATSDEYEFVMGNIRRRLRGEMPDRDWMEFRKTVKRVYSPKEFWDCDKQKFVPNNEIPETEKEIVA